jgi:hypothetical protein
MKGRSGFWAVCVGHVAGARGPAPSAKAMFHG